MIKEEELASAVEYTLNHRSSRYKVDCEKYIEHDSRANITGCVYKLRITRRPNPINFPLDERNLYLTISISDTQLECMNTDIISCITDDIIKKFNESEKEIKYVE